MYTLSELKTANQYLRGVDQSNLWPINGRYNVTNRAIRHVQVAIRHGLVIDSIEDYVAIVEEEISIIVNSEV
jgi:hypothetical protein